MEGGAAAGRKKACWGERDTAEERERKGELWSCEWIRLRASETVRSEHFA